MRITFPALASINDAVNTAYNTQLFQAPRVFDRFTYDAKSTGRQEIYPMMALLPGLREWIGDRVVNSLSAQSFAIRNKTFEETIGIRREDVEDDQFGILTGIAKQLGQDAANLADRLVASLMKNGANAVSLDGQNFFDVAHPNPTATGAPGTIANYMPGNGPPWFLIDSTWVWKPFIWQTRRPFEIIPLFSLTDPLVFQNQEFQWGVDGRANAGYGFWQLAFLSQAPMTVANIVAARTAMASIRRPDGTPLGVTPNLLVVPTALFVDALAYQVNDFIPIDAVTGATTLAPNPLKGLMTTVEDKWLN